MNRSLDQSEAFQGLRGLSADEWWARCFREDAIHYYELQGSMRWVPMTWEQFRARLEVMRLSKRRHYIKAALNEMGEALRWAES